MATLTTFVSRNGNEAAQVLLRVTPPNATARLAGDVCVVVDVSGSMQQEATIKTERTRDVEAQPLSVLDIVKHAIKTLVHTLQPGDRLGIVAYSDDAQVVLPLTAMTEDGVAIADAAADCLNADGQTNLWAGLKAGLDMLGSGAKADTSSTVMVLTDGVPNVEPPGGHIAALQAYGKLPCTVHTFGFGTDLDSQLLSEIACAGHGMYVFIPDASFVGTALVNCTANSLVTMGRNACIALEACEGCRITGSLGHTLSQGPLLLGSLQFGQTKDAVIKVEAPDGHCGPFVQAMLSFDGPQGPVEVRDSSEQVVSSDPAVLAIIQTQALRLQFSDLVRLSILGTAGHDGSNVAAVQHIVDDFLRQLTVNTEDVNALKQDVEGQVREATSRADWYVGWGRHYLLSLARAHLTQQCNNFKDPGVQVYGGPLFQDVRDHADDMFVKLPPPAVTDRANIDMLTSMGFPEMQAKLALDYAYDDVEVAATYLMEGLPASRPPRASQGEAPAARTAAPAYDMRDYYNSAGP